MDNHAQAIHGIAGIVVHMGLVCCESNRFTMAHRIFFVIDAHRKFSLEYGDKLLSTFDMGLGGKITALVHFEGIHLKAPSVLKGKCG